MYKNQSNSKTPHQQGRRKGGKDVAEYFSLNIVKFKHNFVSKELEIVIFVIYVFKKYFYFLYLVLKRNPLEIIAIVWFSLEFRFLPIGFVRLIMVFISFMRLLLL